MNFSKKLLLSYLIKCVCNALPCVNVNYTVCTNGISCDTNNNIVGCINGQDMIIDKCDIGNACANVNNTIMCVPTPTPTVKDINIVGAPCINNNAYSCGEINNLGQGTVVQCVNGVITFIDNCDHQNTNTCVMINGNPYCVLNPIATTVTTPVTTSVTTPVVPCPETTSSVPKDINITSNGDVGDSCANNNAYSCGGLNKDGQGTVVQCVNGILLLIDNCDHPGENNCVMINEKPYCVFNKTSVATPSSVPKDINIKSNGNVGDSCVNNNAYSCGGLNKDGQGTVVQCVNGILLLIDNCDHQGENNCVMIGGAPYCVA